MQPKTNPKQVMDIARPAQSAAPSQEQLVGGIPTTTAAALPVKEPPHDVSTSTPEDDKAEAPAITEAPATTKLQASTQKPKGHSVVGLVLVVLCIMAALAALAVAVYLQS